jgi:hypothetical protein
MALTIADTVGNPFRYTAREWDDDTGLRLGWSLRRIERETGVRRETAGLYLRVAGVEVRPAGWGGKPLACPSS